MDQSGRLITRALLGAVLESLPETPPARMRVAREKSAFSRSTTLSPEMGSVFVTRIFGSSVTESIAVRLPSSRPVAASVRLLQHQAYACTDLLDKIHYCCLVDTGPPSVREPLGTVSSRATLLRRHEGSRSRAGRAQHRQVAVPGGSHP